MEGTITELRSLKVGVADWLNQNPKFTLITRTVGGPPDGVWKRDGQQLSASPCYEMKYDLDTSGLYFEYQVPYNATLLSKCRNPGIYTFLVTNRLTSRSFNKSITIEGM